MQQPGCPDLGPGLLFLFRFENNVFNAEKWHSLLGCDRWLQAACSKLLKGESAHEQRSVPRPSVPSKHTSFGCACVHRPARLQRRDYGEKIPFRLYSVSVQVNVRTFVRVENSVHRITGISQGGMVWPPHANSVLSNSNFRTLCIFCLLHQSFQKQSFHRSFSGTSSTERKQKTGITFL